VRWLISFAAVAVAVIVQLTIVDRIAFPGGTGPDLVLLTVAALALAGGPLAGALTGFWAGLAMDVAPPGSHFVGQDALVFCLVGYVCGLVAEVPSGDGSAEQGHTALFEIIVTAAGAVFGEALSALLGVMLSDPRVSWPAVKHVLPVAAVYDVLLAPFVLFAVAAVLRLAGRPGRRDQAAWVGIPARTAASGASHGAVREVTGGNTPRLRLSERGKGEGWVGGARGALAKSARPTGKHEPRLNLARGSSLARSGSLARRGSLSRGGSLAGGTPGVAFATSGLGGGAAKVRFGGRRNEGVLGGSLLGAMTTHPGLAGSRLTSSRFGRSRMGRSLFGGSVFSRSPSALTRPAPRSLPATFGRSSFLGRSSPFGRSSFLGGSSVFGGSSSLPGSSPRRRSSVFGGSSPKVFGSRRGAGLLRSTPSGSAAGPNPRFARRGTLARLAGAVRGSVRRRPSLRQPALHHTARRQPAMGRIRSPGRGWLRGTSPRRSGTGRSSPRLGSGPARLHMPRPKNRWSRRSWRTGGYR
jgi:rod shape-determining protein MreD